MRYHLTPVTTAIIKKSTYKKCWRRGGEKGNFALLVGLRIGAVTMEDCMEDQKLNIELHYDPDIPFMGIYLKKSKILI